MIPAACHQVWRRITKALSYSLLKIQPAKLVLQMFGIVIHIWYEMKISVCPIHSSPAELAVSIDHMVHQHFCWKTFAVAFVEDTRERVVELAAVVANDEADGVNARIPSSAVFVTRGKGVDDDQSVEVLVHLIRVRGPDRLTVEKA